MNRCKLIIFFFLFIGFYAKSQSKRPAITYFTPKEYGRDRSPDNLCIFQDKLGYIYSGTAYGILRYNGTTWSFIPVEEGTYVTSINQTEDGTIYVSTNNGEFGKLTSDKNGKVKFASLKNTFKAAKLSPQWITQLVTTENDVYLSSYEGELYYYSKNKLAKVPTTSSFHLAFNCNGKIYARERGTGIVELTGLKKKTIATNTAFSDYGVFGILPGKENELLVITQEKGFWSIKNNTATCINSDSISLKSYGIYGAIGLRDNTIALNTLKGGVHIVSKEGKVLEVYDKRIGLISNEIKKVIQDKENNLWLAGSNGIAHLDYNSPLNYYGKESGLYGKSECIVSFENTLYVGTNEGLFAYRPYLKSFDRVADINYHIWEMCISNDALFLATDKGLLKFKNNQLKQLTRSTINTLCDVNLNNSIAIGSIDGVSFVDKENGTVLKEIYFDNQLSRCIGLTLDPASTPTNITLWMGSSNDGFFEMHFGSENSCINHRLPDVSAMVTTRPVILDKKLYFCTSNGLRSLKYEKNKPYFDFANYHSFLDVASIDDLKQYGKRIWAVVNNKPYIIDGKNKEVSTPFLPLDAGQINSIYSTSEKSCWIAGVDCIASYDESYTRVIENDFYVTLHRIATKNDSTLFEGIFSTNNQFTLTQPDNHSIELPYHLNTIQVDVSAMYFSGADKTLYSHRLIIGNAFSSESSSPNPSSIASVRIVAEDDWSTWSRNPQILYTNLREGDYTLEIKAKNIFNNESKTFQLRFTITPPWYRTTFAYIVYGILVILVFILINRILSQRLKKRNEQLEQLVKERTKEIANKNEELHLQNIQITHQKQEITDSINYARKIQEAMLPFDGEMKKVLPQSFVLFKPKDIVSGDFYWIGQIEEHLVMICADCTGHGVPGAFMSMLCIDKLNHIISEKKVLDAGKILEAANIGIKKSLGQNDEGNLKMKDGMDAAVMLYNTRTKTLQYAGANRPLWRLREGDLEEFKPDKCAVGGFTPEGQRFTTHEIEVKSNDCYYTSTDGYADQFGGPKGKKIMVKNFKDLLLSIHNETFEQQKNKLDDYIETWKQGAGANEHYEQVDDVCVIGFKIP